MNTSLEVLFTPAEFEALARRDLSGTVCVVFDILRATTTIVTALANGAECVVPVEEISEALAWRARQPDVLLAGERDGLRIGRELTGSVDFDLGNSPREFTPGRVRGRTIVTTTTNGTRALRACAAAKTTLVGAFLNLGAVTGWIKQHRPPSLLVVCSGTHDQAAYEDTLGAGGLCDAVWPLYADGAADSALLAREVWQRERNDLAAAVRRARNGRRLLTIPELAGDVAFCARVDALALNAALEADGALRVSSGHSCSA